MLPKKKSNDKLNVAVEDMIRDHSNDIAGKTHPYGRFIPNSTEELALFEDKKDISRIKHMQQDESSSSTSSSNNDTGIILLTSDDLKAHLIALKEEAKCSNAGCNFGYGGPCVCWRYIDKKEIVRPISNYSGKHSVVVQYHGHFRYYALIVSVDCDPEKQFVFRRYGDMSDNLIRFLGTEWEFHVDHFNTIIERHSMNTHHKLGLARFILLVERVGSQSRPAMVHERGERYNGIMNFFLFFGWSFSTSLPLLPIVDVMHTR